MNKQEKWKPIPIKEYSNYMISNSGKIKNKSNYILSQQYTNYGYLTVSLSHNGKSKIFLTHRLVALAFIDNPNNLDTVNHINHVRDDNRVSNLEWMSRSDNTRDSNDYVKNKKENQRLKVVLSTSPQGVQIRNNEAIEKFKKVDADWIDKPLTVADKKELINAFDAVRSKGRKASWTTFKKLLIDNGYEVTDKRKNIEGKATRVSIITRAK